MTQGQGQDLEELSKQLNNPVSSVSNITTQSHLYFYKGDLSSAYRGQFVFNFQPVMPIPLTKNWSLISRPVITLLSNPYIRGVNPATGSLDSSRTGSFGDIALVTLLSPNIPGVLLGFGPTFIFPTAPSHDLGQGKFQMGPSVALGFLSKKWVCGIFPQHWWSVAGSRATPVTSHLEAFQREKKHLAEHAGVDPALRAAFEQASAAFRRAYTLEAFKEALAADAQVPDALEEATTSLLILLQRERTRDSAHDAGGPPEGG